MAQVDLKDLSGSTVGSVELDDSVFNVDMNEHLVWEVVKWQRAKARQGTSSTKMRGEVRFTNKKPFKQKGTGRARSGDAKSPVWVGGGVVFGPKPRDYSYNMPRKARRKALRCVLTQRVREGKLLIVDDLTVEGGKTKTVATTLAKLGAPQPANKVLIIDSKDNASLVRGARNLASSKWLAPEGLNVYDVLNHGTLVMSQSTAKAVEEALRA